MAHPITLDRFTEVLSLVRGPIKPLVVIHSPSHYPFILAAHKLDVEVLISSIDLTKGQVEQWYQVDRPVVLLVDRVEVEQIEAITATRRDLQIQTFFVQ